MADQKDSKGAPVNRYAAMFEAIQFQPSTSDRVFTQERSTRISKQIGRGLLIHKGGFCGVPFTVYAVKAHAKAAPVAEVSVIGTRQLQALTPLDEATKAELTEYKRQIAEQFKAWRAKAGSAPLVKTASAVDLGEDMDFSAE